MWYCNYFFTSQEASGVFEYVFFTPFNRQQKVILKTSSATPVKLQLMIEGNHSDYQVCLTEYSKVFPLCNFTNELWYTSSCKTDWSIAWLTFFSQHVFLMHLIKQHNLYWQWYKVKLKLWHCILSFLRINNFSKILLKCPSGMKWPRVFATPGSQSIAGLLLWILPSFTFNLPVPIKMFLSGKSCHVSKLSYWVHNMMDLANT